MLQSDNTQGNLTVQQAAEQLEAMLSAQEEPQTPQAPTQEPEPEAEPEAEPTNEPANADTQDEPEPEPEDGEEGDAEEDPTAPTEIDPESIVLTVKVGDEEMEITAEEARKGYMRQADYTRKTQELAAKRKEFEEAELPRVKEERAQYAQLLTALKQTLEGLTPKEPDWNQLRADDPERFAETWAAWQHRQKQLEAVKREQEQALAVVQADQEKQFEAYVEAETAALAEAIPELVDPEKGKALRETLTDYARKVGFRDEEIAAVVDHRALVLLHKAHLWDESQKRKPEIQKRVQEAPKAVAKPGGKPSATATSVRSRVVSEVTRAKQRAAKTGSVNDAAAVFDLMLQAEERPRRR